MINSVHILGRVGKKDFKSLQSGTTVANLSVATFKKFKDKSGQQKEKTVWHNVTLFGALSEIANNYVNVGDLIYVDGEIDNQKYTGNDGIERHKSVIIGSQMRMIPSQKKNQPQQQQSSYNNPSQSFIDDDIPF